MSAYITLPTPMIERRHLLDALADLGFDREKLEIHDEPVRLEGYEGRRRSECADVVIPRRVIGGASNDVGFARTPTGYRAIISDYDRRHFDGAWLARLRERYAHHEGLARRAEEARQREAEVVRQRHAAERRRLVEAQRKLVVERARELGYEVQEKREAGGMRLVLVKRVYA